MRLALIGTVGFLASVASASMAGVDWESAARIERNFFENLKDRKWIQKFAGTCPPSLLVVDGGIAVPLGPQASARGTDSKIWLAGEAGVAVKLIGTSVRAFTDLSREKAVLQELRTLNGLSVGVHSIDSVMSDPCRVRMLVTDKVLTSNPPFSSEQVARVAVQSIRALQAVHAHGILHGDVHLGNILVSGSGVRLIDFGRSAAFVKLDGSRDHVEFVEKALDSFWVPAYLSPWELDGSPLSRRDDMYRLSELLYWLTDQSLPLHRQSATRPTPSVLAERKRNFSMPGKDLLNRFHAAMVSLTFDERPDYDLWVGEFERVAAARGIGL